MKITLASASPRRKLLLRRIVPSFQVIVPACREYHLKHITPAENAKRNALRKAKNVWGLFPKGTVPKGVIIGADTIVVYQRAVIGKPKSLGEARKTLKRLSGKVHEVITGVALLNIPTRAQCVFHISTKVKMKKWSEEQINQYLKRVHVLDKAGSYGIQESPRIVERISGSYTNVIGLPIEQLRRELKKI